MVLKFVLLLCCLHLSLVIVSSAPKLETVYEWKYIDYTWKSDADRAAAIKFGYYDSTKPKIIDVDVWKDGKVFVTVMRRAGVPASLTTVSRKFGDGGPLLQPYPNWKWARNDVCKGIINAFRVAIDECDRLWVLDNGQIDDKPICEAQLFAFDLNSDLLLDRVIIPASDYGDPGTEAGLMVSLVVEVAESDCERTHVYIADVTGHAFFVWNGRHIWRLPSMALGSRQSTSNATIARKSFELADGVLAMALTPRWIEQTRSLVYQPFGSFDIKFVSISLLQQSIFGDILRCNDYFDVLSSQAFAMAFSSQGILFFGLTSETGLACWNTNKPNIPENIVMLEQNRETLQFTSGLKVIPSRVTRYSEAIWMVTNRFKKIAKDIQNFDEVNFRIITGTVGNLIAFTNCDSTPTLRMALLRDYHSPVERSTYDHDQRYW